MTTIEIGERLRAARQEVGMTQGRVAELAGCSKPSVIAAEQGKSTLRLATLVAISAVLGLEVTLTDEAGR